MKQLLLVLSSFVILSSACQPRQAAEDTTAIPQALSDDHPSSFKKGREDLLVELYNELAEKTADLKKLEEELSALRDSKADSLLPLDNYKSKNREYYRVAGNYLGSINDTLLRQKVKARLKASELKYEQKTARLQTLADSISANTARIEDLHIALKIFATQKVMEGYQKDQFPSDKPLRGYIHRQDSALQELNRQLLIHK